MVQVSFLLFIGFCSDYLLWFENFASQTEPVNINEESGGIDQNTQIRNQGIIALSYRDWEVKPCMLPRAVCFQGFFCCKPSAHMLSVLYQEIVRTFEISEPVISSSQSRQRLTAWHQLKVTFPMGQLHVFIIVSHSFIFWWNLHSVSL